MIKRIDLTIHLETIKAFTTHDDKITVCCFEGLRYWTYSGKCRCERDLISTWLIIEDEINQEWGQKYPPRWAQQAIQIEYLKWGWNKHEAFLDKPEKDFNDEIPF